MRRATFQRLEWLAVLLLWCAGALPGVAGVPRVGVVTKDADAAISDLVFERLSRCKELELVERDKLRAVVRELEIGAGARGADVQAGTLLGAQGLLFVETDADFRHFTLVETSRGERLFDLVRPRAEPANPEVAEQVSRQVLRYLPQLTTNGRAARHIAVMPFEREDGVTPRWHDLDVLTVLVGSTLAQHPRLIVVERANLADVTFEPALAGVASNALATADFVLRGSAKRIDAGHMNLNVRLNPSRGGEVKAASFVAASTNLHDSARQILEWTARELEAGANTGRIDTEAEAALHFARGTIYRAQGKPDPLRCFELAHELAPTNRTYAATYLSELQARWDGPVSLGTRCELFLRALDVQRTLDPEMKGGCLPVPAFLNTLPRKVAAAAPMRVLLFPLAMTNRIGSADAEDVRRLIAGKLAGFQHLDVLAAIADVPGDAIRLSGTVTALDQARVRLHMGLSWNPWKATSETVEGKVDDLESLAGELANKLVRNLPPDTSKPLPREDELCRDGRRAAEDYFKRYCRLQDGLPDIPRRNLWATICPVFFDTPEEALRELRRVSALDGYDWNLAGHRFQSVTFWDTPQAHALWLAYLDELCRTAALPVQLQAHRALNNFHGTTDRVSNPTPGRKAAAERFFTWLASDAVQPEYAAGHLPISKYEFWITLGYLRPELQLAWWDRIITPRLRHLSPEGSIKLAEIEGLQTHLVVRCPLDRTHPGEQAELLRLLGSARDAVHLALSDYDPKRRTAERCDERAAEMFLKLEDLIRGNAPPPASPPDRTHPGISGATLLFDYRRDLAENLWSRWPVIGSTRVVAEGAKAWIGFTAAKSDNGPGLLTVVALDGLAGTSRLCAIEAPGVGTDFFRTPVLLAKTRTHVCLAEFHNVLVLPLAADGAVDERGAVFLGPEQGLPAIGLHNQNPLDSYFVSAVAGLGEDLYLGLSRPTLSNWHRPISYGGLFRWSPGATGVTRIAACDSLGQGPLNDCLPYVIEEAVPARDETSLLLSVKTGPRIMQLYGGTSSWWKLTATGSWGTIATPPAREASTNPWRVTTAPDGKTFALEFMRNGQVTIWQTFDREAFSPGELAVCDAGLLWLVHRERPLVYFIPRTNWPAEANAGTTSPNRPEREERT